VSRSLLVGTPCACVFNESTDLVQKARTTRIA
jgi:hypothetical protein